MRRALFLVALLLLLLGVIINLYPHSRGTIVISPDTITDVLNKSVNNTTVRELPIANSEEMQRAVSEQLNYDWGLLREYTSGGKSFTLYLAYWAPGRFHPRLISGHTPDICWTHAGWRIDGAATNYSYDLEFGGHKFVPAQYRYFFTDSAHAHVLYWHMLGGQLSGYSSGENSKDRRFFVTFISDAFKLAPYEEQYFVRISSATPLEELSREPSFQSVMNSLAPLLSKISQ